MEHRTPVTAGLRGRCPRCGEGPLFEGFLAVRSRCPVCDLDLAGQDSGDGPVAFIVLVVGAVVVGAALLVEVRYGWPVWLHMLVWLPLAALGCLASMRPLKGLMIALQYRHLRHSFDGDRPDRHI
ncbi:MAG: DUF983 domain-containing protein [Geminicoccaceae bacterium]|nr:DUF983 domain-containing protein [Geminicoccaceae bacterium]